MNINLSRLIGLALIAALLFISIWYVTSFFCATDNAITGVNCLMIQTPLSALAVIVFLMVGFARSQKNNTSASLQSSAPASHKTNKLEIAGWLIGLLPIALVGFAEFSSPNNLDTVYLVEYARTAGFVLLIPCVLIGLFLIRRSRKK